MDFMKVLDQTVREIKREVNLKVLKVPEIEQKVLDATSSEPWGPHGSDLSELAQATNKITDCRMIMNALWTRLTETGSNWRHVYKALAVIEYLVANGSQRAVDDILEHTFRISSLSAFEFVEPNGKDTGINVRKKVETILALINDKDKIQAVRDKAATNRDKYFGLSSTGITYKSSSTSYGSTGERYGGMGSTREDSSFKDSYKDRANYGEETDWKHDKKDGSSKSRESGVDENDLNTTKKGVASSVRPKVSTLSSTSRTFPKAVLVPSSKSSNTQASIDNDDFDDFDPRGSSAAGSTNTNNNQMDLFGESLVGDLMDAPAPVPREATLLNTAVTPEDDLFADVAFESVPPLAEATEGSHTQNNIDLFATQPAFPAAFTSNIDLMGGSQFSSTLEAKTPNTQPEDNTTFDPFAAIPLNSFEGPDAFGAFTSQTAPVTAEPSLDFANSSANGANQTSQNITNNNINGVNQPPAMISKPAPKKDTFQVKSGIWADSLSRGLIDLNITAPKKVSLADIGIVGGLDDGFSEKEKGLPPSSYMGRAMGAGSNLGWSGFTSAGGNSNFSTPGQQQFGSFK